MPSDLSQRLVIGVSSRALFDMEEANRVYETHGLDAYIRYQMDRAEEILRPGTGFALIRAILDLNRQATRRKSWSCRATVRRRACACSIPSHITS
jgi:5'-nucleotidase